jgi:RND family efflux transporter MFP subunit
LEHAIIYDGLTVNQLNAAKSEVYANQSLIETASKTVENIKQSIASLKIGNTMSYDAAKLAFDLAEKDLENAQKRLLNAQTQAEIQVNSAESQVKAAKEQVDVAKDQLAKTVVYSPLTGIIGKKYINVGEIAMVGAPIFTVVNTDFIKVEIHLTEFDIGRVALGQNVEVSFSAYPGEIFSGIIYQIDSVADSSKKFPVRIQIDNRDGRIKAGMVAKTNIILSEEANVLVVPREAVFMQKNAAAVYVIGGDDRIEIRLIETEQIDEENLRVVEGLETGDEIVMQGNFDLSAGQEVKIKK